MRLLLSGGSHRAALGATGAIGYFLWSESMPSDCKNGNDRWSDITEVVSVSGGSIVNAALAANGAESVDETVALLGEIRRRHARDGLLPHRTIRRAALALTAVAVLAVAVWILLAAFGVLDPRILGTAPWSVLIGLAWFPVLVGVLRRVGIRYQLDFLNRMVHGPIRQLHQVNTRRRHIICASGLASGLPYYFVAGGTQPFEPVYGTALASDFSIIDAAAASTALPAFGRVRAPQEFRGEMLVDGGVSGSFGEQVGTTSIRRSPKDTWRSDGDWFAVDAVRHLMSNSKFGQLLQSVSMIALLGRWLKVSLEATYVNDIVDLGPGQFARVWSPNELPAAAPTNASVFRDGSTPTAVSEAPPNEQRVRLGELQRLVNKMGLAGLNRSIVDIGIVVGFVSTLEVRRGLTDPDLVVEALRWLDDRLDAHGQLLTVWTGQTSFGQQ